jgi:hypothetical protein
MLPEMIRIDGHQWSELQPDNRHAASAMLTGDFPDLFHQIVQER